MALKFKKLASITVTAQDPAFKESSYANEEFTVNLKPLTRVALQKLNKECTTIKNKEEVLDQEKLSWKIFDYIYESSDVAVDDENGKPIKDGSDEYKKALYENFLEFVTCLTASAIRYEEKCRGESDAVKN